MKERRATIKERRQVADLIAIKSGRAARTPEDIEKAANLSDAEIIQFLQDNAPKAEEVEEIRPDEMPADLFGFCMGLIDGFCSSFSLDKTNLTPLQWGACCSYIGRGFSSRSLFRVPDDYRKGKNKKIDAQAVADLLPIWADLCGILNKVPLAHDFANFCGLSWDWLYKIEHGAESLTPEDINIYKRLKAVCRGGLDARLIDSKAPPVGAIFYAKAKEGYQETQIVRHEVQNGAGSVANLPDFGQFREITDKNSGF